MSKSGWYKLLSDPYLYGLMIRKEGEVMSNDPKMLSTEEYNNYILYLDEKGVHISLSSSLLLRKS